MRVVEGESELGSVFEPGTGPKLKLARYSGVRTAGSGCLPNLYCDWGDALNRITVEKNHAN
jgi:hypothetical protein